MKLIDLIKTANSSLGRNKVRTGLTIVAIIVGSFTLTVTTGINTGVNKYIDAQLGNVGGENTLIVSAKTPSFTPSTKGPAEYDPNKDSSTGAAEFGGIKAIDEKGLEKIRSQPQIQEAYYYNQPSVEYISSPNINKKYVINLTEALPGTNIDIESGRQVDLQANQYEITLEPDFATALGFKNNEEIVNNSINLVVANAASDQQQSINVTVVGIQSVSLLSGVYSNVNPALSKKIRQISQEGMPESVSQNFAVIATLKENLTKEEVAAVKNKLNSLDYEAQTIDDQIGIIRSVINGITGVLIMFAAIALLAASFGIINTLYMAVQERTQEIGLLKAIGLSNRKIFSLFSLEAVMIGFWGSVIGIGLAILAGMGINHIAETSFLQDLTGFTLVQFTWQNISLIIGIICLIAFFAGTLPAIRASKLNPINALRYE